MAADKRLGISDAELIGQRCGRCGKEPATGWAFVNGERFCHGDNDPEPTCYMLAQQRGTFFGALS